ncbi:hypothetical protein EX30DRAFT_50565 [Ascodesmis nigricans]|uniref:Uncharacterized protein n=1 Tax=Ascodesmis nigricans TaxID=341454 RepID=A0A4S2MVZ4_9PEZI|nr:hypothetical protein EX30DRAFT_50565 [Ascodesmis nigricans]
MKATFAILFALAIGWPLLRQPATAAMTFRTTCFPTLRPLFGEQFAKQFMSESMFWLDHIIFAMAPLGILTAIVSAIRVGGPPWLRAVIGRARENRATVEMELMSSTSHEVCELWNGQGVVRAMGKPKVQQIIYLDDHKDLITFGLHTLTSDPQLFTPQRHKCFRAARHDARDQEDCPPEVPSSEAELAPNISLNLHGGSQIHDLYAGAIFGVVLQVGMLIFCGFTVYHTSFRERFRKDGHHVQQYGFPIMLSGTVLLAIGMIVCSWVVEQSTWEEKYLLNLKKEGGSSDPPKPETKFRVLWLQKSHTVSDQVFDSYVLFRKSGDGPRDYILTSKRDKKAAPSTNEKDSPEKWKTWIQKIAADQTEFRTILGVLFGLFGFILQFQGLRAMNWSASIAQLVCIFLMTIWRAWVRRGLIAVPVHARVPEEHEMDWLALRIAETQNLAPSEIQNQAPAFWPERDIDVKSDFRDGLKNGLIWKVFTSDKNFARAGKWANEPAKDANSQGLSSGSELNLAQRALDIRKRLGDLTNWTGPTFMLAVAVARSVEAVMNSGVVRVGVGNFTWPLDIQVNPDTRLGVQLSVEYREGRWEMVSSQVDAALSLWLYHIRHADCNTSHSGSPRDRLPKDKGLMQKVGRVMGSRASHAAERDNGWWIGNLENYSTSHDKDDGKHPQSSKPFGPIGFVGIMPESVENESASMATQTDDEGTKNPASGRSDEKNHGNLA